MRTWTRTEIISSRAPCASEFTNGIKIKTHGKVLSGVLILSALSAGAVEAVPGVRGQGPGSTATRSTFSTRRTRVSTSTGVSVSFWVKGNSWAHQACIIAGLGGWKRSFRRFFSLVKGVLWSQRSLRALITIIDKTEERGTSPPIKLSAIQMQFDFGNI